MRKFLLILLTFIIVASLASCSTDSLFGGIFGSGDEPAPEEGGEQTPDTGDGEEDKDESDPWADYETITVAEALELCTDVEGHVADGFYYIRATVDSIDKAQFGAMTISDATGSISVYKTTDESGMIDYADLADKPMKGDAVLLQCILQNFDGNKEVKCAYLIDFYTPENKDAASYTEMSISEARAAADGTKIKLDGVVARITFANGYVPNGVMLVDETSSIYVFSGDVAQFVEIGNKITVTGEKDYWILDTEKEGAEKFGYKGANQIANATLIDNDGGSHDFDKSWITETTVKSMIETSVTEDVTSKIFKVTAMVTKVPGTGFVNYYFNDLDYIDAENPGTGTYTYTQCNGGDFSWLDQFNGKICTVYLTALNAKSTNSASFFRFLPVAVYDEGFVFDTANAPQHVVDYYALAQLGDAYDIGASFEVVSSVSSEVLGFENATVTYTSADESVISFTNTDGVYTLTCNAAGKTTVTATATYNGASYSASVEITVKEKVEYETITVSEAIATAPGSTVTVKGIVGPSIAGTQPGFYLIDETGAIAVTMDSAVIDTLKFGQQIVLRGTRNTKIKTDKTYTCFGQTQIMDCEILANDQGYHEYDDSHFITDESFTVTEFYNLDDTVDHTTEIYVIKGYVKENQYNYTFESVDGSVKITLYASGKGQYSWLSSFVGQEITVEIAPCNWNSKSYYAGCILAVITEDGKVVNLTHVSE